MPRAWTFTGNVRSYSLTCMVITIMVVGVIGSRFGDAALKELAVQSDVVAERHVDKALNRKRYSKLCIFINLCMKPSGDRS